MLRGAGLSLLGVSVALGGCGAVRSQPVRELTAASATLALPGPAPRGRSAESAAELNRTCEGCHQAIATEWRASFHARSHTDPSYARAFAIEPLEFCQGCHAPETDPRAPVPVAAAEIGVGCVTCHVVGTDVLAGPEPANVGASPHAVRRDGRLATSSACSACHEFAFPDRSARARPELMQATLSEHLKSEQRSVACASCHMPTTTHGGVTHRSHAFAGGHDPELVRSAVAVEAERTAIGARITLTPRELGHAFPTGDLFRRLEVSAEALGTEWQVVSGASRYLARHWQRQPSPFGVVLRSATRDDRPLGAPQVIELELDAQAATLPIHWRVTYQRVDHPRSDREQDESVEGEIEISSGVLEKDP